MAEKKTSAKKTTTKVEKEVKKVATPKTETKCECNCGCNETMLNRIFYCLLVLTVISALILVTLFVNFNGDTSKNTTTSNGNTQEEELGDYDVSMFDTLSTTDAMSKISDGSKYVVYIGRSTCGYCVKFLPTLQKAQGEYGYKTIYINLEEMTSTDQENIKTIDNDEGYISENLGYTPMVLVFENGKLADGWVGYAEYDSFAEFLEKNGYSK